MFAMRTSSILRSITYNSIMSTYQFRTLDYIQTHTSQTPSTKLPLYKHKSHLSNPSPNPPNPLSRNPRLHPPPRPNTSLIQQILKRKQKRRRNHTLRNLRPNAPIQTAPSLLPHHPPHSLYHRLLSFPSPTPLRHMHARLHCDIRVCNTCRE